MSTAGSWRETPQRFRLEAATCRGCGKVLYPPRRTCPKCRGRDFKLTVLPFEGKLVSYTVIRTPPPELSDLGPYALGIIELEGGVRMHCQISDCSFEDLRVGMPLQLEFRRIREDGQAGMIHYGHKAVPLW